MVDVQLQYSSVVLGIVLFALGIIKLVSQQTVIATLTGYLMMLLAALFVFVTYEQSSGLSWIHRSSLSVLVVLIAVSLCIVSWISSFAQQTGLPAEQSWNLSLWRRLREASLTEPEAAPRSPDEKDGI